MTAKHAFVTDDAVLRFFGERTRREREELLRIFATLADDPYRQGEWRQKTKSGRELQVKRFGKWLVSYWRDELVLEVRIVDVNKIVP
jgi:hypothetical protein